MKAAQRFAPRSEAQSETDRAARFYGTSLKKALDLLAQPVENFEEEVGEVMDRTRIDRMLVMALDQMDDLEPGKWMVEITPDEMFYTLHNLAVRLSLALEEVNRIVHKHAKRDEARTIWHLAREEGRIPEEGGAA